MQPEVSLIAREMIKYEKGRPTKVNHLLKVHSFAKTIGALETIDSETMYVLEVASLMHDIGINPSTEKYDSSAGPYQQLEGPPVAKKILKGLQFDHDIIERVCYLIAHHHTYNDIDGTDYQILVEADFIVNIFEESLPIDEIKDIKEKHFKTSTGIEILNNMYLSKA